MANADSKADSRPSLGKYVLGPRLAVGGMGEIFVAFEASADKPPLRALKVLLPHLSESRDAIQMFLNEAQLTVRMNHPNVVRLFDVGAVDGRYFLVMELVHGMALSTLIRALKDAKASMPAAVVSYVGRALCNALHHAHELTMPDGTHLEVIHRDVTPDNVLISIHGEVKLSDFGIAKARATASSTVPGSFKGKYEYAAPEQLKRGPIDRRVDVFGAGLTLYQAATLTSPFRRDSEMATLNAIAHEELPPLKSLRPDLSGPLLAAIGGATEKNVDRRTPSAEAFHDALPAVPEDETRAQLAALLRKLCEEPLEKLEAKVAQADALIAEEKKSRQPKPSASRSSGVKPRPGTGNGTKRAGSAEAIETAETKAPELTSPGQPRKTSPIAAAIAVAGALLIGGLAIWLLKPSSAPQQRAPLEGSLPAQPIALPMAVAATPTAIAPRPPPEPVAVVDAGEAVAVTPPKPPEKKNPDTESTGSYFIF